MVAKCSYSGMACVTADVVSKQSPERIEMQVQCPSASLCVMQITMKFNHNGTHIEGMGFKHGEHRVIININAHDSLEGEVAQHAGLQCRHLTGLCHLLQHLSSCF